MVARRHTGKTPVALARGSGCARGTRRCACSAYARHTAARATSGRRATTAAPSTTTTPSATRRAHRPKRRPPTLVARRRADGAAAALEAPSAAQRASWTMGCSTTAPPRPRHPRARRRPILGNGGVGRRAHAPRAVFAALAKADALARSAPPRAAAVGRSARAPTPAALPPRAAAARATAAVEPRGASASAARASSASPDTAHPARASPRRATAGCDVTRHRAARHAPRPSSARSPHCNAAAERAGAVLATTEKDALAPARRARRRRASDVRCAGRRDADDADRREARGRSCGGARLSEEDPLSTAYPERRATGSPGPRGARSSGLHHAAAAAAPASRGCPAALPARHVVVARTTAASRKSISPTERCSALSAPPHDDGSTPVILPNMSAARPRARSAATELHRATRGAAPSASGARRRLAGRR